MESIIRIENLNYYPLFSNLTLKVRKGSFLSIIGRNGCGKSMLFKILLGLIPTDSTIQIENMSLKENKQAILKHIGVVFENPNSNFIEETPRENMKVYMKNLGYAESKIKKRIDEVCTQFEISSLLDCTISNLSGGEKQLVTLALALLHEPSILLLDDAFSMIDGITKEKIFKILRKYNREQKLTIIQITHDMDDILYGKEIAIIDEQKIILHQKKEKALQEEIFKKAGLELPFMASLSSKLKFYDLIDAPILDMDKMVNTLWK